MALHRLTWITVGVPNPDDTRAFYRELGLTEFIAGRFATASGGEQLRIIRAPQRRVFEIGLGVDDVDDLRRIAASLEALSIPATINDTLLRTTEPATSIDVVIRVAERIRQADERAPAINRPGHTERTNARAEAVQRTDQTRPRKLSHIVLGSKDPALSCRFFVDGVGFKVSDEIPDVGAAFMRCSNDHHDLLVQQAPLTYLHHTAWEVGDADEIGRGAARMLASNPERHVWGLGRHRVGSNFFWYLRDPAGNFAEYSSDLDVIADDQAWKAESWSGLEALMAWGPPVPPSFLAPHDLATLMAG